MCVCVWFMFTDVVPAHIYISILLLLFVCLFVCACVCVCVKISTGEVAKLNYECLTTHHAICASYARRVIKPHHIFFELLFNCTQHAHTHTHGVYNIYNIH